MMDEIKKELATKMTILEEARRTGVKPEELARIKTEVDELRNALYRQELRQELQKKQKAIVPSTPQEKALKQLLENTRKESIEMEEMLNLNKNEDKIDNRIKGELK
jgi:hypothetical protein